MPTGQQQTRVQVSNSPTGELRPFVDNMDIRASSHGAPWDDFLSVELVRIEPGELEQCYIRRTTLVQPMVEARPEVTRFDAPSRPTACISNEIHLDPSGSLTGARWTQPLNILFLMPSELTFQRVLYALHQPPTQLELVRTSYAQDLPLRQIGETILAECCSGFPSGRIYGESLALALAARLVSHYSRHTLVQPDMPDGLPPWRLRQVIEFIEDNIAQPLNLSALAAVAQFSEFHFSRMFKRSTGLTPHRYVLERRIVRAKELLVTSNLPLHEISALLDFGDQSHMTTVFKRLTGVTPGQFRKNAR